MTALNGNTTQPWPTGKPARYLPLEDRNFAAHMLLNWIAGRDPDLVADAVVACSGTPGVREVERTLLENRAALIRERVTP